MIHSSKLKMCCLYLGIIAVMLSTISYTILSVQTVWAGGTNKAGKLNNSGIQANIGRYYYTESSSQGFFISTVAGEKGKLILSPKMSGMSFGTDIFITGKYIYYSYSKMDSHKIYRMNLDGSGKKLLVSFHKKNSYGGYIDFVYKDEYLLYSCAGDGSDVYNYSVNLKKKKIKFLKGYSVKYRFPGTQDAVKMPFHYKNYYAAVVQAGDFYYDRAWIYNTKTQKFKCISTKAWDISIAGKYVYYIENSGENSCKLKRCTVDGKRKKTLCSINGQYISFYEVTDSYCIYEKSGVYYKYDFAAGTTVRWEV